MALSEVRLISDRDGGGAERTNDLAAAASVEEENTRDFIPRSGITFHPSAS